VPDGALVADDDEVEVGGLAPVGPEPLLHAPAVRARAAALAAIKAMRFIGGSPRGRRARTTVRRRRSAAPVVEVIAT
jgi:hypothetical protein